MQSRIGTSQSTMEMLKPPFKVLRERELQSSDAFSGVSTGPFLIAYGLYKISQAIFFDQE